MSWRERLQPGSIGGVAFHTVRASGSGGRRLVVHEYPLQEVHYVEDMGPSAGSQRMTVFVVGSDYDLQRDELIKVLDSAGPHTLVHPYLGSLSVHVKSYEWAITTRKGGYAQFNIEIVTAGKRQYPKAGNANAKALQAACTHCSNAVQQRFAQQFSITSKPGFVQDAAQDQFNNAVSNLQAVNGQFSTLLQQSNPITEQLDQFSTGLSTLLQEPASLASEVSNLVAAVMGSTDTTAAAVNGYNALTTGFAEVDIVPLTTPTRKHQAQNQLATQQLLTATATVETARLIASQDVPFATYNQAITTRDLLLEQIDTLIETSTDDEYYPLVDLQTALAKRVDEVAPGLQKINHIQLQQSVPALVLAHQLYGDATKADELISRNSVKHPSFMPAGEDLEVLV